jgi:hypothetical protein
LVAGRGTRPCARDGGRWLSKGLLRQSSALLKGYLSSVLRGPRRNLRFRWGVFGYVAHWSGGDTKVIQGTADRVVTCARSILERAQLLEQAATRAGCVPSDSEKDN